MNQKLLKKMFKNRGFWEELLKKLLNDFAASRRKLLKNPFLSNFSCLKKTLSKRISLSVILRIKTLKTLQYSKVIPQNPWGGH